MLSILVPTVLAYVHQRSLNSITEVNRVTVPKVAFANVVDESLFLTSFNGNPFGGKDYVYVINDPSILPKGGRASPSAIPGEVIWPNTVEKAPASLFGKEGIIISGGFLVPGHNNGGIWFSSYENGVSGKTVELFRGGDYFYHKTVFYDVDQNGQLDMLTCRAKKGLVGSGSGDLTWLEPVDRKNPLGKWKEKVIGKGCDTLFHFEDITGDGKVDMLVPEFWGKKLTLIQSPSGRFDDWSKLVITTIDANIGNAFDAQFVDINGDGRKDILATNHEGHLKGSVFAYEIPTDLNGEWKRHTLANNFPVKIAGPGQASPGAAIAHYPTAGSTGKPNIVVSGDATKTAYLMTPVTTDVNDWTFDIKVLHDCDSTVGAVTVADFDKDGKSEIYVPCYEKDYLVVYSY